MRAEIIENLDQLARDFINGEVEPLKIHGLNIFDMWAVLTLASTYSLAKIGTVSRVECATLKYHILSHYEMFRTRTVFFEKMYSDWVQRTRDYSSKRTELTKALTADEIDIEKILVLSMSIIDLLTKEDIYLKLFQRKCDDKMFKAHSMQAAEKHIDEFFELLGNDVPYAKLLERFYSATVEDKIADLFKQLDPETFRDKARRGIPLKKDELKDIAVSMETMYAGRKRRKK